MSAMNAAVVYGAQSGLVRWYVHAETDAEIGQVTPGAGESLLLVPLAMQNAQATYQAAVNAKTGLTPGDPRCAVLDSANNVLLAVLAAPNLDAAARIHPQGASLMPCPNLPVAAGDRWNPAVPQWERFYSVVLKSTNIVTAQAWLALLNPVAPNALTEFVAPGAFAIGATVAAKTAAAVTTP